MPGMDPLAATRKNFQLGRGLPVPADGALAGATIEARPRLLTRHRQPISNWLPTLLARRWGNRTIKQKVPGGPTRWQQKTFKVHLRRLQQCSTYGDRQTAHQPPGWITFSTFSDDLAISSTALCVYGTKTSEVRVMEAAAATGEPLARSAAEPFSPVCAIPKKLLKTLLNRSLYERGPDISLQTKNPTGFGMLGKPTSSC